MFTIFLRFNLPKRPPNRAFFQSFLKTSILLKSLRNTGCAHKNQGSDVKKNTKNRHEIDSKTYSKKASTKSLPKIDFGLHFGLQKPPNIDKKSKKKRLPKKTLKHKLCKSPQIIAPQAFWDPCRPSNYPSND